MSKPLRKVLPLLVGALVYWGLAAVFVDAQRGFQSAPLPPSWFYSAFLLLPCTLLFCITSVGALRWTHLRGRFLAIVAGTSVGLLAYAVQIRLVVAYARAEGGHSAVAGLLSNFYILQGSTFVSPIAVAFLSSAFVAFIVEPAIRRTLP